jgi:predicted alpha-1,2-mannosidase
MKHAFAFKASAVKRINSDRTRAAILFACISLLGASGALAETSQAAKTPVDHVDPFMGTSESRWMQFPGATMPFGMVQLSPNNQMDVWFGGYEYTIASVHGFSHFQAWEMAGLSVMPTVGLIDPVISEPDKPSSGRYGVRSPIDKNTEEASPGYYATDLLNYGIRVELTSTTRCGFFRFTFPETDKANVYFHLSFPSENKHKLLDAKITRISNTEIEGYSQQKNGRGWNEYTVHFVARFNKPFKVLGGWEGPNTEWWALSNIRHDVAEISGKEDVGTYVTFDTKEGEAILLQTGISLVSIEQARLNLETELTKPFGWNFDAVRKNAHDVWNHLLGKIEVKGGTETDKKKFYTNLYRCYCARQILSDVNGKYKDPCEVTRQTDDPRSPVLGSDAFWMTFWNLNQLWTLVNPDIASMWVKSQLEMHKHGGYLARGPAGIEYSGVMDASHEIALIASAYQKGIRDYDTGLAWEAVLHQQNVEGIRHPGGGFAGNGGLNAYMESGYMPIEAGLASNTLEYCYDDWCVCQLAKAMGKTEHYKAFLKRANNYRNMFDPETRFMRPRYRDGGWLKDFDPLNTPRRPLYYSEGNGWKFTYFVPHDMKGLIELIGKDEFNRRLNEGFERSVERKFNAKGSDRNSYVNHGNQPTMHVAWLFNHSGKPWLTQKWVREIQNLYYGSGPYHAWLGDEDEGQMSAWFVLSAMGLFQTDGGTSVKPFYEIGSPLFSEITIQLDKDYYPGKKFVIEGRNASDRNRYIQSVTLNGQPLNKPWFYHSDLVKGGKLTVVLGDKPNQAWGSAPEDAPPSMKDADPLP